MAQWDSEDERCPLAAHMERNYTLRATFMILLPWSHGAPFKLARPSFKDIFNGKNLPLGNVLPTSNIHFTPRFLQFPPDFRSAIMKGQWHTSSVGFCNVADSQPHHHSSRSSALRHLPCKEFWDFAQEIHIPSLSIRRIPSFSAIACIAPCSSFRLFSLHLSFHDMT